ncbi:MAG: NAD-dependent protein deacetylase [Anaerolineae bacterium]
MGTSLEQPIEQAARLISQAKLLVVSSGAGISKESGIPTFRDALTGLWAKYNPEELATRRGFRRNPDLVWSWYMMRRDMLAEARPNPGHYAVAELERLLPRVVVLTQNIDGLHIQAGSSDVVELHGSIRRFKCFDNCRGDPTPVDLETLDYSRETAPRCPHCGTGYVRPDVVWFGEMLPAGAVERAFNLAALCDVMLVVGTSGTVQPAASLPVEAKQGGARVIEVNPEPGMITPYADIFLQGPSGEVLPRVVAALRAILGGSMLPDP